MIGRPRYGPVGLLGLPYNLVFEALGPLIEVCGYAIFVVSVALGLVDAHFIVLFFLLAVGYGVLLSVAAVMLDQARSRRNGTPRDVARLLLFTVVENFGYRQLQTLWRAQATLDYLRKKGGWGEMRRRGFEGGAQPREHARTQSAGG